MKKNEVLALDNMYVQHSRLSFEGGETFIDILITMVDVFLKM